MDTVETATILIALWGALLSTILAVREYFKDRRKVKVTYSSVITSNNLGNPITLVEVKVVNIGHRPITITGGGLLLSDGRTLVQPLQNIIPVKLPARLDDGDSVSIYLDLRQVRANSKDLAQHGVGFVGAFVRDTEGKQHLVKISQNESAFLSGANKKH